MTKNIERAFARVNQNIQLKIKIRAEGEAWYEREVLENREWFIHKSKIC